MRPTVVDYFSGAGGLSEGFKKSGYEILLGVDYDESCIETFSHNNPESISLHRDVGSLDPHSVLDSVGYDEGDIDVVIGGPPCQGFSIAGDREEDDDRNQLFRDFAEQISVLQPKFLLMENVPGMLSMETPDGRSVVDEIHSQFDSIGYHTEHKELLASNYGVPQNRRRVFIIGTRLEDISLNFPNRTNIVSGQTKKLTESNRNIRSARTTGEALSDLEGLSAGESSDEYTTQPKNEFQRKLRSGMNSSDRLRNHSAVNHRNHIVERFKHIPQGGDMTDAPEKHQPKKTYSSRNRRLPEDEPSYTVTAHVLDELIHPWDDRAVTVREAARLQSFPDDYVFKGERNVFHGSDKTSQYEQVGNAVPVLLAQKIAEEIRKNLTGQGDS